MKPGTSNSLRVRIVQYLLYCAILACMVTGFAWFQFTQLLGQPYPLWELPLPALVGVCFGILIVRNIHLSRKLGAKMVRDGLTGACNRYWFQNISPTLLEESRSHQQPLSIILFDIDHFKQINDTWGHHAGDEVLQAVASTTLCYIRKADWLVRWGGEEFMVVMPQTDIEGASITAEKLRYRLADIRHPRAGQVTCSFGVALFDQSQDSDLAHLVGRADARLYQAKQMGRNRVCVDFAGSEKLSDPPGDEGFMTPENDFSTPDIQVNNWLVRAYSRSYIYGHYALYTLGFMALVTVIAWLHIEVMNGIDIRWSRMIMPPLCGGIFGAVIARSRLLHKALQRQLVTDSLTGVFNRHWLDHYAEKMLEGARRYSYPLSIALTDVDHFKKVNDTYGHNTGDEVLKTVAMRLQQGIAGRGSILRWGGEEFVILMPHMPLSRAMQEAEQIRTFVADSDCDPVGRITASIGVARFDPERHASLDALVADADKALYMAKQGGRNRVAQLSLDTAPA